MKVPHYFLRRLDPDVLNDKFIAALNKCSERYNSIKTNYPQSLTWFKNFVTATLIMSLERMASLEDESMAYKIQESLADYYSDEIEERWNELQEFGIRESITRMLREELNKKQKVFYGFSGLKNQWVDDNDKMVNDDYFEDKEYQQHYFDNFNDMDMMFGHKYSLFGTRWLEPGDPNRTSKSFDTYNKAFGPMIVRVI